MKKKIVLLHSIKNGSGEISELEIDDRLQLRHFKNVPSDAFDESGTIKFTPKHMIPLIAAMAGISEEMAEQIDIEDFPIVAEAMAGFLSPSVSSPGTGGT